MMPRISTVAFALALATSAVAPVLNASTANADTTDGASSAQIKAARAKFQEGVRLYDKGQYEKARAAFLQTYALHKHPAVLLNLAQSCLRAGHALEADNYFRQFMREATMTAESQKAAESGLAEARTKVARLDVRAADGASITVDGVASGSTPMVEPIDVEPGNHVLHAGTEDQNVTAVAGQTLVVQFTVAPIASTPNNTPAAAANGSSGGKSHLLDRPKNMVPVYVAGGVAGVGILTGIILLVAKGSATSSANDAANLIMAHGGGSQTCAQTDTATVAKFGDACSALSTDNSEIKTDGVIGDVALIVGLASLAGGVAYYLFADKADPNSPASAASSPSTFHATVTPAFGRGFDGLSVVGTF